jgi:hypothetical protein
VTKLPIGIQTFDAIRNDGYLYVDKTQYLLDLIDSGKAYFLSRPRRFGKSLTISTFDALFSGKKDLFRGLYAESFFDRRGCGISPVLCLDMSRTVPREGMEEFKASILDELESNAARHGIELKLKRASPSRALLRLIEDLHRKKGPVVVLVDEYDKPMLDFLRQPDKAEEVRGILHDFYAQIKSEDKLIRFVFMTGISKFSKMGIFSAMNNLKDISSKGKYASMLGYTEEELLFYFAEHIDETAAQFGIPRSGLVARIQDYYDGFSFDGENRLYNPFSTLNFFDDRAFGNYWFESGTPSYLANYVKERDLEAENFRGLEVDESFTSVAEIERASPESFLFQSGYLTVRERRGRNLVLDYPNKEVLSSVASLFLYGKLKIPNTDSIAAGLENALARGDAEELVKTYDKLLATIPYDIYEREERKYADDKKYEGYRARPLAESFYHAILFTLMWASRVDTTAENHSYWGRSDLEARKNGRRYVLELKVADGKKAAEKAAGEAMKQIREKRYADKYRGEDTVSIALAVDRRARRVGGCRIERIKADMRT